MRSISVILSAAALVHSSMAATVTKPLAVRTGSVPAGYAISDMQFTGTVNGEEVKLSGTVQEIYAKIQEIDPTYTIDTSAVVARDETIKLNRRNKSGLLCCPVPGQYFIPIGHTQIESGISYLTNLAGGTAVCGVGANTCSRISCSYQGAIYLCNDNPYYIEPSCKYLATYAQDILDQCQDGITVCGQEFDSDNYNIVVDQGNC